VETFVDQDNPDFIFLCGKWTESSNQESYMAWRAETGLLGVRCKTTVFGGMVFGFEGEKYFCIACQASDLGL
jgi:hypothetical protein